MAPVYATSGGVYVQKNHMLLTKYYVFPEGIVGKCFRFQEVAKDWFAASCHVTQNGRLILLQLKFQSCPHYGGELISLQ